MIDYNITRAVCISIRIF